MGKYFRFYVLHLSRKQAANTFRDLVVNNSNFVARKLWSTVLLYCNCIDC